jgi:hypothetical protein
MNFVHRLNRGILIHFIIMEQLSGYVQHPAKRSLSFTRQGGMGHAKEFFSYSHFQQGGLR